MQQILKKHLTEIFNFHSTIIDVFADYYEIKLEPKKKGVVSSEHVYRNSIMAKLAMNQKVAQIALYLPKNSSKMFHAGNIKILENNGIPVRQDLNRSTFRDWESATKIVKEYVNHYDSFSIYDHGGYFAPAMQSLCSEFGDRLKGFTEFTRNGDRQYLTYNAYLRGDQSDILRATHPLLSNATTSIKRRADKSAGKAIVLGGDLIIRRVTPYNLANIGTIGLVGYGNVGESVGKELKVYGNGSVKDILVSEVVPRKEADAFYEGFSVTETDYIASNSDFIISATGGGGLKPEHYDMMKDGAIIGTATSPDDELGLDKLIEDGVLEFVEGDKWNTVYRTRNGRLINILLNGQSLNVVLPDGGINDPSMFAVNATNVVSQIKVLYLGEELPRGKIISLNEEEIDLITKNWCQFFGKKQAGFINKHTIDHSPKL